MWIALCVVLLFEPFSLLRAGTWLSFAAVALLLYGMSHRMGQARVHNWLRPQWLIALGLVPMLAFWFYQFPVFSVLANVVAIPW